MATINKDFKIKSGLIVEGSTATVGGYDVLTKKTDDQNYIIGLIGGSATPDATPDTVVLRDENADFSAGTITADLVGDVTGTVSDISNHNTDALGEGTGNLYFTNQRALTATASAYDAAGSAANAEAAAIAAAQDYTDAEISDEILARDAAILVAKNAAEAFATQEAGDALTSANSHTDDAIAQEVLDRNSAISTAKGEAIDAASSDATSKANAALSDANDYTDAEIVTALATAASDATTKADAAEANAKAYADGLSSGLNWKAAVNVLATSNVALTGSTPLSIDNHTVSDGYRVLLKGQSTDAENGIYEMSISGGSYTLSRPADADAAAEIIGAAVFVMEGDNYASTAWVQADHYLTTFAGQDWTQFSGQGTYLAGNGLTLDGTTFEIDTAVTETVTGSQAKADAAEDAAIAHTDAREIAITTAYENYADGVGTSANTYTDGKISTEVTDRNNAIDSAISTEVTNRNNAIATAKSEAISTAEGYADGLIADEIVDRNNAIDNAINALDTDDIEEGVSNLYFEDSRAKASAAELLTGASKTNIQITGDENGLTITAENGVADSTTSDLAEGSNLYFTDARAVSALEAVVPVFEAVEINSVAKQVATEASIVTASTNNAVVWSHEDYRSAEFLVNINDGTNTQVSKVVLTLDASDNVAITEYAIVNSGLTSIGSVSASVTGSTIALTVTTVNNGSTVHVVGTLLK